MQVYERNTAVGFLNDLNNICSFQFKGQDRTGVQVVVQAQVWCGVVFILTSLFHLGARAKSVQLLTRCCYAAVIQFTCQSHMAVAYTQDH